MNNNSMNNNENIVVSVHMQEIINKLLDQIKDYSFHIAFLAAQNEALRKKLLSQDENKQKEELKETQKG